DIHVKGGSVDLDMPSTKKTADLDVPGKPDVPEVHWEGTNWQSHMNDVHQKRLPSSRLKS
ncbi:hypothetical protein, partial [Streptococcus cristatus]|uniref:hypothetical protein n=1 Tax=Streptococcus cristatus TaxID=45634 RepID=UPI001E48ACD6